jgi:hypothetical protein
VWHGHFFELFLNAESQQNLFLASEAWLLFEEAPYQQCRLKAIASAPKTLILTDAVLSQCLFLQVHHESIGVASI